MLEARSAGRRYVLPCCLFLAFLYGSYDIERSLVPLNKYYEEDPERAHQNLVRMVMVPEDSMDQATLLKFDGSPKDGLAAAPADWPRSLDEGLEGLVGLALAIEERDGGDPEGAAKAEKREKRARRGHSFF